MDEERRKAELKKLKEDEIEELQNYEIAKLEYNANMIPFIVKRNLPDGSCEYWRFKDLEKILFD